MNQGPEAVVMTTQLSHQDTQKTLEEIFLAESPSFDTLHVRAHLRSCARCRESFNEFAEADTWMGGGREEEDESFEERYSRLVMESAAYQSERLVSESPPKTTWWEKLKGLVWSPQGGAVLAFACSAALVSASALFGAEVSEKSSVVEEDLQARGAQATQSARPIGWIEPFCVVEHAQSGVPLFQEADEKTRKVPCNGAKSVKFALVNHGAHGAEPWAYGTLIGVPRGREKALHIFRPLPTQSAQSPSFKLPHASRMAPLGASVDVDPSILHGSMRLVVVLTRDPVSMRSLDALHRKGGLHTETVRSSLSGHLAVLPEGKRGRGVVLNESTPDVWSVSEFQLEFGATK